MYICKTIKEKEPKLKLFFDDLLLMDESLKIDMQDLENKLREFEKG
jgi:hypothetical protein